MLFWLFCLGVGSGCVGVPVRGCASSVVVSASGFSGVLFLYFLLSPLLLLLFFEKLICIVVGDPLSETRGGTMRAPRMCMCSSCRSRTAWARGGLSRSPFVRIWQRSGLLFEDSSCCAFRALGTAAFVMNLFFVRRVWGSSSLVTPFVCARFVAKCIASNWTDDVLPSKISPGPSITTNVVVLVLPLIVVAALNWPASFSGWVEPYA